MSTELINDVYHIDGPACRGFAIAEHPDGTGNRVEVIYRVLRYIGTKAECEEAYQALMNLIESELQDLEAIQLVQSTINRRIIWWRHRVEYNKDPDSSRWSFYCRLATTPPLPDSFWERWETQEGAPGRNAKEVCG